MAIYVTGLNYKTTEKDIEDLMSNYGDVKKVTLVLDRETGKSKGAAFVEMDTDVQEIVVIAELNDTEFMSRNIRVEKAKPNEEGGRKRGGSWL